DRGDPQRAESSEEDAGEALRTCRSANRLYPVARRPLLECGDFFAACRCRIPNACGEEIAALQEPKSAVGEGQVEVFLEVLRPSVPLAIFGGGPDAVPLCRLAGELGWHVTVVDGRPGAVPR